MISQSQTLKQKQFQVVHDFIINSLYEDRLCPFERVSLIVKPGKRLSHNKLPSCLQGYEAVPRYDFSHGFITPSGRYRYRAGVKPNINGDQAVYHLQDSERAQTVVVSVHYQPSPGVLRIGKKRCGVYYPCAVPFDRPPLLSFTPSRKSFWRFNKPMKMRIVRSFDGAEQTFVFRKWKRNIRSNVLRRIELDPDTLYTIYFSQGNISSPAYTVNAF